MFTIDKRQKYAPLLIQKLAFNLLILETDTGVLFHSVNVGSGGGTINQILLGRDFVSKQHSHPQLKVYK